MAKRLAVWVCSVSAAFFAAPRLPAAESQTPAKARFVYVGDAQFAPYDYLDDNGRATGFNVELVRALARDAGVEVEFRLGPWYSARTDLDAGSADLISFSYSEERVKSYAWLAQTWTMHQCVLFLPRRAAYPHGPGELGAETIVVQERSAVAELLFALPPPRPALITVATQDDALRALEQRTAGGVGGNSLSLRVAATQRGLPDLVEMPLRAVPYGLWTRRGREGELAWVATSLEHLKQAGTVEALAERFLAVPPARRSWRGYALLMAALAGLALAASLAASGWNRSLRQQVNLRTRELAWTEERYRTFLALSSEGIARFELSEPVSTDQPEAMQIENILRTARLAECNAALLEMWRVPPQEKPIGVALADLARLSDLVAVLRDFVGHGYRSVAYEGLNLRRDGSSFWTIANSVGIVEGGLLKAIWLVQQDITARKLAEDAVRASEKKYRGIVDFAPMGIYQALRDGTVITANLAFARLLGYETAEDVLGLNMGSDVFVDAGERDRLMARYEAVGQIPKVEVLAKRRDGTTFWAEGAAHIVRDAKGEMLYIESFVRDISARKEAEAELRASEERYRLLFDGNPLPMLAYDLETLGFVAVNEAAVRQYGYAREELLELSVPDLAVEGDGDLARFQATRFDARPDLVHVGARRQRRKDGMPIDVDMTSLSITFAGRPARLILARDVTAEKQAQAEREQLRAAIERAATEWQRTLDAVDTAVLILDPQGRLKRINRAARDLLGDDYPELVGRALEELAVREPWPTALRLLARARGVASPASDQARDPARAQTWDVTAYVSPASAAERERIILVVRDVTRLTALQESLRKTETMAAMGSLVAGVAHEVRNPLFSISATVDALESELGGNQAHTEYTELLRSQVARLTVLMRDLLDYGKPPALKIAPARPAEIIRRALRSCAPLAHQHEVTLAEDLAADLPQLELDAARAEQVFENLVANAIQHSPRGGRVCITARGAQGAEVAEFTVDDEGRGIAPDDVARLFEPFFSRRKGGTGLGLSVVQRIVEAHGGRVAGANRSGGGASFTLRLPVTQRVGEEARRG